MTAMRTVIVDDEAPARRRIRRLLAAEPGLAVAGECGDGESALALIARERPDLVFLDVQMPERDGFEVVKAIPAADLPAILFVTAHDRYALRAFDVHAVDFLLKPFSADRFRTAVGRARERIARRLADPGLTSLAGALRAQPAYLTRLPVRTAGRTVFVDLAAVDWMDAADNYVRLHVKRASTWCAKRWRRSKRRSIPAGSSASTAPRSCRSIASRRSGRSRTATRCCGSTRGPASPSAAPGAKECRVRWQGNAGPENTGRRSPSCTPAYRMRYSLLCVRTKIPSRVTAGLAKASSPRLLLATSS